MTEAKREETRKQRLANSVQLLAEGKMLHWKYQPAKK
ncbi:MAG: YdeI/OmpD-associated family protein [Verrucomicrobiaceae bacterium]|nr:YdeI/OmpD-associated family protein [Verrucomicrobiaceae bacterium]